MVLYILDRWGFYMVRCYYDFEIKNEQTCNPYVGQFPQSLQHSKAIYIYLELNISDFYT